MASQNKQSNSSSSGIRRLELINFKSIENSSIEFSPLTIILGANSAGKSSAMQSLVLIAQNAKRDQGSNLMLNGSAIKLGTFAEVRKQNSTGHVSISIDYVDTNKFSGAERRTTFKINLADDKGRPGAPAISQMNIDMDSESHPISLEFTLLPSGDTPELKQNQYWRVDSTSKSNIRNNRALQATLGVFIDLPPSFFAVTMQDDNFSFLPRQFFYEQNIAGWIIRSLARRFRARIIGISSEEFLNSIIKAITEPDLELSKSLSEPVENDYFQDLRVLVEKYILEFKTRAGGRRSTDVVSQLGSVAHLAGAWSRLTAQLATQIAIKEYSFDQVLRMLVAISREPKFSFISESRLLPFTSSELSAGVDAFRAFEDYLKRNVHYLGPLRLEPTGSQNFDGTPSTITPIGNRGELMGFQLKYGYPATTRSKFPLPPDSSRSGAVSLENALSAWSDYFGLGLEMKINELGQSGFSTEIDGKGLHQMGTGVSQILPVLGICLMAKGGSTVFLEQPELHLHPAAQQRLGDFLLIMARAGRRIVVETHSEYLVTRLRKLIAVDKMESSDVNIVFAQRTQIAGNTEYVNSRIGLDGTIETWPEGFFDYSSNDKLEIMLSNFNQVE